MREDSLRSCDQFFVEGALRKSLTIPIPATLGYLNCCLNSYLNCPVNSYMLFEQLFELLFEQSCELLFEL